MTVHALAALAHHSHCLRFELLGELPPLPCHHPILPGAILPLIAAVHQIGAGSQTGSKPRFYEPKTTAGKRIIDLTPELVHALKLWKLACPKGPLNLIFPNLDGSPRHRTTITYGTLRPALKAAGLRQVTLHSLRHTCASALILAGTDCLEAAKFLGHAKPTVTMSTVAGAVFCESGTVLEAASDKVLRV